MQRWKVRTPTVRGAVIAPPRRSERGWRRGLGRRGRRRGGGRRGSARPGARSAARRRARPRRSSARGRPGRRRSRGGRPRPPRRGPARPAASATARAQRLGGGVGEVELDDGAGDVPGDVLAADEVVGGGVVERVGLDDRARPAARRHSQAVQPAVDADRERARAARGRRGAGPLTASRRSSARRRARRR